MAASEGSGGAKPRKPRSKPASGGAGGRRPSGSKGAAARDAKPAPEARAPAPGDRSLLGRLTRLTGDVAGGAYRFGTALLLSREPSAMQREAGAYLRELRELAGLTLSELAEAMDLRDRTLLQAVEEGTATLSFDLILRLSAILARHDPVPFIARMTRSYNPAVWRFLESWGADRLPLQFERERRFVNVYRSHDAARELSEEGFERVLAFTRSAFELALHFVAREEHVEDAPPEPPAPRPRRERD